MLSPEERATQVWRSMAFDDNGRTDASDVKDAIVNAIRDVYAECAGIAENYDGTPSPFTNDLIAAAIREAGGITTRKEGK